MRPLIVVLTAGLVALLAVVMADLQAPRLASVGMGSVGLEPQASGLALLPPEEVCEDPAAAPPDRPCSMRYAYAPNGTLTTWVSVRNDGPLPVTLVGVEKRWLDQYRETKFLAQPISVTDGGDPLPEPRREPPGNPFAPIVLQAGDERMVVVEFRTTSDLRDACERWMVGSGVGFRAIPIEWEWLVSSQTQEIAFEQPITFMAPAASDCAG